MIAAWHGDERRAKHGEPEGTSSDADERADDEGGDDLEEVIRCAACLAEVTRARAAVEVQGRHAHTFMNPAGQVFHVRCFDEATGAACRGPPTTEYSWFPPSAWRFAHCRGCGAQLGWAFDEGFFALMREMLVDPG